MDETNETMDHDFCRYDSDCQQGYVCELNKCALPRYLNEIPSQNDYFLTEVTMDSKLGEPYAPSFCSSFEPQWIMETSEEVVYTMDECGNIFDANDQLIWGNGECILDNTVIGTQSSVISATNRNDMILESDKSNESTIIVHADALIEPQLNTAARIGLYGMIIVQLTIGMLLLLRYLRYAR